jgi:hypothetical protein
MDNFDPQQGHRPGFLYGRDPHTGLPENLNLPLGTCLPPWVADEIRRNRGLAESEYPEPDPRDRSGEWPWPSIPAGFGAVFLLYSVTAGSMWNASRLNPAERVGYIALGLGLLVVAAVGGVALARRHIQSWSHH